MQNNMCLKTKEWLNLKNFFQPVFEEEGSKVLCSSIHDHMNADMKTRRTLECLMKGLTPQQVAAYDISLTTVLSTVILAYQISRVVRMISRHSETLDLICRVMLDEKFLTSGMNDPTNVFSNQISFLKYFTEINLKI